MHSIRKYMHGYVRIRLESPAPERFFSLCVHNQISLWNLVRKESGYELELSTRDFFLLDHFRRKTGSHIHIIQKKGLPFFLHYARKRKAFFLGMLLGILLMYLCSLRIWNIQISGNHYYTTPAILNTLADWNVKSGMPVKAVDCQQLMSQIRQKYPEIVWVSARLDGTCLLIEIKENEKMLQAEDTITDTQNCWNLSAPWDGTVVRIITRSGMPRVKPGDSCKKGDVLVSGRVEILDNDNQVQRYHYVRADADIVMKINFPYYDEFSRNISVKSYPSTQRSYPFFTLFGTEFSWYQTPGNGYEIYRLEKRLSLTPGFYLPITTGKILTIPYVTKTYFYSRSETEALAQKHLTHFLQKLASEQAVILSKSVRTDITSSRCLSRGFVTVEIPGSLRTDLAPEDFTQPKTNPGEN